jgi:hypothetical protein
MHQGPRVRNSNSCDGMFSSSVDATFTWMKRSHYSLRGHRISKPGLRRVRGHTLNSVIFQRDPEFGSFGSAPERSHQVHEYGRPLAPQNRPWFPSGLSLSHPPSLLDIYTTCLSLSYVYIVGETLLLVCSRSRPGSRIGATL